VLASLEPEADGDDARCNDGRGLGVQVPFVNLQQRWVCGVLEPCRGLNGEAQEVGVDGRV
jgi:hypothetical protein